MAKMTKTQRTYSTNTRSAKIRTSKKKGASTKLISNNRVYKPGNAPVKRKLFNTASVDRAGIIPAVLGVIFFALFLITFFRITSGSMDTLTFTSFLEYVSGFEGIDVSKYMIPTNILGDWGLFNGLRDFVSTLLQITNFGIYITGIFVNVAYFIIEIVRFIVG